MLFSPDGRVVAHGERPTPTNVLGEGRAEHDMAAIERAMLEALAEALARINDKRRVRSIAVASMGEAGVLVDGAGRPLCEVIAWYDTRTTGELRSLEEIVGRERIHAITGLCPDPTFSLAKLLWLRHNRTEAFERAARWLHVSDYLAFRLCGVQATDTSLASRTMALDLGRGCWSAEMLAAAEVPLSLPAEIVPMGTRLGGLRREIADELGLDPECVVGAGGHDHVAGAIAIAADRPGTVLDSMGTAEALTLVGREPSSDVRSARVGLNQGLMRIGEAVSYYVFGGLPTSAGAIEWFRRTIAGDAEHSALVDAASKVQPGSFGVRFLPHLRLGSPPYPDPVARGAFHGLGADVELPVLYRAVLEGVALDIANVMDCMLDVMGARSIDRVVLIGGSTRNALLVDIKAALWQRPVEVVEMAETVALGAAALGGIAAGIYGDLAQAQDACRPLSRRVEPDAARLWGEPRELKARYARAYELQRQMNQLSSD